MSVQYINHTVQTKLYLNVQLLYLSASIDSSKSIDGGRREWEPVASVFVCACYQMEYTLIDIR